MKSVLCFAVSVFSQNPGNEFPHGTDSNVGSERSRYFFLYFEISKLNFHRGASSKVTCFLSISETNWISGTVQYRLGISKTSEIDSNHGTDFIIGTVRTRFLPQIQIIYECIF